MALVLLMLALLAAPAAVRAESADSLSLAVANDTVSLQATNASLARVLREFGEATGARVVIETALAEELARARVDMSFSSVPVAAALRRLLRGHHYVVMYGRAGVDEVRIFADGATGYRELTPPNQSGENRPTSIPLAGWPPDDPAEVARLRSAVLHGPDASSRATALDELSNIQDRRVLVETFAEVLGRERDGGVLSRLLELAAQQHDRVPPEALRAFVGSGRDGSPRAQAVELLASQAGDEPATRALLRSLAAGDVSPEVRRAAATALEHLEAPPARTAADLPVTRPRSGVRAATPTTNGGIR